MYNGTFTKAELENIINCCLQKLRRLDRYLLDEEVNERTITHKLAEYLQQHILNSMLIVNIIVLNREILTIL